VPGFPFEAKQQRYVHFAFTVDQFDSIDEKNSDCAVYATSLARAAAPAASSQTAVEIEPIEDAAELLRRLPFLVRIKDVGDV
jgi:hypothetical protein